VVEQGTAFDHDAPCPSHLIWPWNDVGIQPWERKVTAVVHAQAGGVERFIVDALDLRMNVSLLVVFYPFGKGIFDFTQSGARSDRSYRVDDRFTV